MRPVYEIHPLQKLPQVAAERVRDALRRAVDARGRAHLAVSGGSTPRPLFRLLAQPVWRSRIPWAHVHVWWVDERCVPPDHHENNYAAAYQLLFRHLSVMHLHRMHGELEDPWEAAAAYENELRRTFHLGPRGRPHFDLILLGMGEDGHTASLFPGTPALEEQKRLVTVGEAPVFPHRRLTLTLPVLNRAANVLFLVAGANKGPALRQVFHPDPDLPLLPAARVRPARGRLLWLLDENAALAAGLDGR
ncbi:MAG: 6-phosphogluconolactonase [Chloroflexi bacterium]|nr:6-phosphogluconolactonase [Chloroflexota bacterium]